MHLNCTYTALNLLLFNIRRSVLKGILSSVSKYFLLIFKICDYWDILQSKTGFSLLRNKGRKFLQRLKVYCPAALVFIPHSSKNHFPIKEFSFLRCSSPNHPLQLWHRLIYGNSNHTVILIEILRKIAIFQFPFSFCLRRGVILKDILLKLLLLRKPI